MKRLLLALLLLPSLAFAQFPSTPVIDTFDGSQNPLAGIWTNTVFGTGGCQKSGGIVTKSLGGTIAGCYVTETFGADQEAYSTVVNPVAWSTNTTSHILACLQPTGIGTANGDGYAIRITGIAGADNDRLQLWRITDSTWFSIADFVVKELAAGDNVGIEIKADGTINGYHKTAAGSWTLVTTANDTVYSCEGTHIGLNIRQGHHEFDNFGGGDLIGEEPPPPATFPTHAILDTFLRGDEIPLVEGLWRNEATTVGFDCGLVDNTLRWDGTGTGDCYIDIPFSPPIEAYATLPAQSASTNDVTFFPMLMCLRSVGTSGVDGYAIRVRNFTAAPETITIERLDNRMFTAIGDPISQELASGSKIGAERLSDGTINVYADTGAGFVFIGSEVDTIYDCVDTYIGARFHDATHMLTDYGGGGFGFAPPASLFFSSPLEFK